MKKFYMRDTHLQVMPCQSCYKDECRRNTVSSNACLLAYMYTCTASSSRQGRALPWNANDIESHWLRGTVL
jgi:hypothetical protein